MPKQSMRVALYVLIAIACVIAYALSPEIIFVDREVRFHEEKGTALFIVRGRYNAPLTIEGPFPPYLRSIELGISSFAPFKVGSDTKLSYGDGFSSLGWELKGGEIYVSPARKMVTLSLNFTDTYRFGKNLNGTYRIASN